MMKTASADRPLLWIMRSPARRIVPSHVVLPTLNPCRRTANLMGMKRLRRGGTVGALAVIERVQEAVVDRGASSEPIAVHAA